MSLILMGIMLFMLSILYFQVNSDATYRDGKLFLITINQHAYESEEVQALQLGFKKRVHAFYLCLLLVGIIPITLLHRYAVVWLILWLVLTFFVAFLPLKQYRQKLKELKKLRNWPIVIDQDVHVDLALSSYMEHVHIAKVHYAIPIIILTLVLVLSIFNHQFVFVSVTLLQIIVVLLGMFFIRRIPNKTYGEDTNINIQVNILKLKSYYRGFLYLCMGDACFSFSMTLSHERKLMFLLSVMMMMLTVFFTIHAFVEINKFQEMRLRIIARSEQSVYHQDCDEYWRIGIFGASYNNPNDSSFFVSSPNGLQFTPNMAKPGFLYAILIVMSCSILFFAYLFGYPYILDLQHKLVNLSIDEQRIMVDSPFYHETWNIEDILDVELVDDLGKGRRIHGTDAFIYGTGDYNYDRYGECLVYLALLHKTYIVFHTKDKTFIINDDDVEATGQFYKQMEKQVNIK